MVNKFKWKSGMQHWILRCKHCQREYVYCTYGNGPEYGTEAGCSQEYCAECQKAIDEALSRIPVKFKETLVEIDGSELREVFEKIKAAHEEEKKGNVFPDTICYAPEPTDYDITEVYQHDFKRYEVKWYKDKPEDKHVFAVMEYDLLNKKVTGKAWKYEGRDSYSEKRNLMKSMCTALQGVKAKQIDAPDGNLMFSQLDFEDFEWEVLPKKD